MVGPQLAERSSTLWLQRVYQAAPVAPIWVGVGLAVLGVGAFLATELALGRLALVLDSASPDWLRGDVRIAMVLLLMLAYLPTARAYALRGFRDSVEELGRTLTCSPSEREALQAAVGRYEGRGLHLTCGLGVALAVLAPVVTNLSWNAYDVTYVDPEATWHRFVTPGIGWLLSSLVYVTLVESLRLSRLGRERVEVDLLDRRPFAPFARQGLRNALLATGFLGLAALLLLDLRQAPGLAWVLLVLYGLAVALAGAGLLLPVRGLRANLRARKRAELAWCDGEIRLARERLVAGRPAAEASPALADLAAYRGLVASVPEWPFDAPTLARFGLYLAIPIGSWLGGALVERLVDAVLG